MSGAQAQRTEPDERPTERTTASEPWPRGISRRASMRISDVLAALRIEFPAVTTSKLRFLEEQGLVEPVRTPAGYRRIVDLRRRLIARGAHVVAPCPHDNECPLTALPSEPGTAAREKFASKQKTTADWCHFVQRLPRLRAHKHLKGAELPFEDEKFSYVALSRTAAKQHPARVLTQPLVSKVAVTAKLWAPGIRSSKHPSCLRPWPPRMWRRPWAACRSNSAKRSCCASGAAWLFRKLPKRPACPPTPPPPDTATGWPP